MSTTKEALVNEFACRWNYALPAYPPANFDYAPICKDKGLKVVDAAEFNRLKSTAPKSEKLAYQIDNYVGMFRDREGKCYD